MNNKEITLKELAQAIEKTIIEQTGQIPGSPNRPPKMGFKTYIRGKLTEIAGKIDNEGSRNQNPNPKQGQPQTTRRIRQGRGRVPKYWVIINEGDPNDKNQNPDPNLPKDTKPIKLDELLKKLQERSEQQGREGQNLQKTGINPKIIDAVRRRIQEE